MSSQAGDKVTHTHALFPGDSVLLLSRRLSSPSQYRLIPVTGFEFSLTNYVVVLQLKSIYESFICPICLEEITDAFTTSCGHNACEQCIRECLNRRHQCPICNAETTQDRLVKNHHLDALFRTRRFEFVLLLCSVFCAVYVSCVVVCSVFSCLLQSA